MAHGLRFLLCGGTLKVACPRKLFAFTAMKPKAVCRHGRRAEKAAEKVFLIVISGDKSFVGA
jgi:hypothetical protein